MKRRAFGALVGGVATASAVWPSLVTAQQPAKLPTIGFLGAGSVSGQASWTAAFSQRLRELGWTEGRTVAIEYRWGEGRNERFDEFAAEFVRLKVDIIVTNGGATRAAKKATSVIPIVFAVAADPLGSGYVASLSRPRGNVTGLSSQASDTAGKRLGLLRELLPGLRRLAILVNPDYPAAVMEAGEAETAGRKLGIEVMRVEFRRVEDVAPAIEGVKGRADALYVCTDSFATSNRVVINTSALAARLPTMHGIRILAEAGGLMSYGANFPELHRRAGEYVDKILRGAKPGDLPVEQPTKFDLVINLKTAKELDLVLSPMLLARADEVIE